MERTSENLRKAWSFGIGMAKIDGGAPSELLLELAEKEINGEITHEQVIEGLNYEYKKTAPKFDD